MVDDPEALKTDIENQSDLFVDGKLVQEEEADQLIKAVAEKLGIDIDHARDQEITWIER